MTENNSSKLGKCQVCKSFAQLKCSGCKNVFYCTKEHQKEDWSNHKIYCSFVFKIEISPELGRCLIATRDLKAGKIIFKEKPLIISFDQFGSKCCFSCFQLFDNIKGIPCPRNCGLFYCGEGDCQNSDFHKYGECQFLIEAKSNYQNGMNEDDLAICRIIALEKSDLEKFFKILNLQSNSPTDEIRKKLQNESTENLIKKCNLNQSHELIEKIQGILNCNKFSMTIFGKNGNKFGKALGLYYYCSFFEHNCTPNCYYSYDHTTFELKIISHTDIKEGDHLKLCYTDEMWPNYKRLMHLEFSKQFICKCSRCNDPTELGSHFSCIICQEANCKNIGFIVTTDPYSKSADWKCTLCNKIYKKDFIESQIENAKNDLDQMNLANFSIPINLAENLELFLEKYKNIVHKNHYLNYLARKKLLKTYNSILENSNFQEKLKLRKRKIQICQDLVELATIIIPGFSRLKSIILFELAKESLNNIHKNRNLNEINYLEHKEIFKKYIEWMEETYKILKHEPNSENSKLFLVSQMAKSNLNFYKNIFSKILK